MPKRVKATAAFPVPWEHRIARFPSCRFRFTAGARFLWEMLTSRPCRAQRTASAKTG